jgi:hypothetical protein
MTEQHVDEGVLSTADMAYGATGYAPETEEKESAREEAAKATATGPSQAARPPAEATPLLAADTAEQFRSQWGEIQTGFVDEPRKAVEQADSLVAEVMQRLAQTFADERKKLEGQWDRGDNISTEDLRVALQRYRSFFDRPLSV